MMGHTAAPLEAGESPYLNHHASPSTSPLLITFNSRLIARIEFKLWLLRSHPQPLPGTRTPTLH
jgi:hypothetical protein